MKRIILSFLTSLLILGFANGAKATIITFDDLDGSISNALAPIPDGYNGLNWHLGESYGDPIVSIVDGTTQHDGFINGIVSPNNVAYTWMLAPGVIYSQNGSFLFNGTYMTRAYNNGNVLWEGYNNDTLTYSKTITLSNSIPIWEEFDWTVDKLVFSLSGNQYDHLIMDNMKINEPIDTPTPEPSSIVLMLMSLAGRAIGMRKRI